MVVARNGRVSKVAALVIGLWIVGGLASLGVVGVIIWGIVRLVLHFTRGG